VQFNQSFGCDFIPARGSDSAAPEVGFYALIRVLGPFSVVFGCLWALFERFLETLFDLTT
jgi:hypothetical protein